MANYDLRLDVPACAYINAQLFSLLERGGTLWDAAKHLFAQEYYVHAGLDPYSYRPYNHSLAISLLYCTIVVPREILDLPASHTIYRNLDSCGVTGLFRVTEPAQVDSYAFLRCLRNAVAHALFSITLSGGEWKYEFWTERDPIFRASVGHDALIHFMSIVGKELTNAVLARKPGGAEPA